MSLRIHSEFPIFYFLEFFVYYLVISGFSPFLRRWLTGLGIKSRRAAGGHRGSAGRKVRGSIDVGGRGGPRRAEVAEALPLDLGIAPTGVSHAANNPIATHKPLSRITHPPVAELYLNAT